MELNVYRPFIKIVQQVIDEDGSVKDSAVCYSSHLLCEVPRFSRRYSCCLRA